MSEDGGMYTMAEALEMVFADLGIPWAREWKAEARVIRGGGETTGYRERLRVVEPGDPADYRQGGAA